MKMLSYSDVNLVPQHSKLPSRADADISVNFLGRKFKNCVIPANMASVINEDIAKWLAFNDYFYIMHRFCDVRKFIQKTRAESWPLVSISVGVKAQDMEFIRELKDSKCRVDYITIDIAHGHSVLMKDMIRFIKEHLPKSKIIAGNITTREALIDLSDWGADAAKVGIAGGAACSTKNTTGFHIPMFSCVEGCLKYRQNYEPISVIADGGIKNHGDIAKALVAGADMVMAGSLFAACLDAPGETIIDWQHSGYRECDKDTEFLAVELGTGQYLEKTFRGKKFKVYYGSASAKNKENTGQPIEHIEGVELEIPCNGLTYEEKYKRINQDLASAVSYAGGESLSILKSAEWVEV